MEARGRGLHGAARGLPAQSARTTEAITRRPPSALRPRHEAPGTRPRRDCVLPGSGREWAPSEDGGLAPADSANRFDIWILEEDAAPHPLIATRAHEMMPAISPDGRWLAYTSDETGRRQVYVQPFPNLKDGKWMVSTNGGVSPVWSPGGRELFYTTGRAVMSVALSADGGSFSAATPELLFEGPFETGSPQFAISPDGTYFVMVEADPDAKPQQIHLVLDWIEELARTGARDP